jgi:hypothetical protein
MLSEEEYSSPDEEMKSERNLFYYFLRPEPKPETEDHRSVSHNELVLLPKKKTRYICRGCGVIHRKKKKDKAPSSI